MICQQSYRFDAEDNTHPDTIDMSFVLRLVIHSMNTDDKNTLKAIRFGARVFGFDSGLGPFGIRQNTQIEDSMFVYDIFLIIGVLEINVNECTTPELIFIL